VPDAKEYISETIDDPEAIYRRYGIRQGLRWSFRSWHKNGIKDVARSPAVRTPEQYPTKEQQKACLEMAAAELIREITQGRSLNQI
jgi:hypothetical protein